MDKVIDRAVTRITDELLALPAAQRGWIIARLEALARGATDDEADAHAHAHAHARATANALCGRLELLTTDGMHDARHALGLTQKELAARLGLKGGARTVAHWEAGTRPVTGPVILATALLMNNHRSPENPAAKIADNNRS